MWSRRDLLTSTNQFTFMPNCTKVVNSVKYTQQFIRYYDNRLVANDHVHRHTCTDGPKTEECLQYHSNSDGHEIKTIFLLPSTASKHIMNIIV